MNKLYRLTKAIFLPLVLIFLLALFFLLTSKPPEKELVSTKDQLNRKQWANFHRVVSKLNEIWNYPDHNKEIDWKNSQCPWWNFEKFHSFFDLRQNPLVLNCVLNNKVKYFNQELKNQFSQKILIKDEMGHEHYFSFKSFDENNSIFFQQNTIKKTPSDYLPDEYVYLEIFEIEKPTVVLGVTLNFEQKQKYLPQANYFYGQDISVISRGKEIAEKDLGENYARVIPWDNWGRHFFIDKYPVRNYEVQTFLAATKNMNKLKQDIDQLGLPAIDLTLKEQEEYCLSIGKKLLQAYIWDGATFYRSMQNYQENSERSLYYFGDRWPKNQECQFQPTLECKKTILSDEEQMSWMGVSDITNNFEYLANDFDPFYNLKPASKNFSRNSAWQILGHRLHWNGLGFDMSDFNWISSILGQPFDRPQFIKNPGVRFRCMKEWVSYP